MIHCSHENNAVAQLNKIQVTRYGGLIMEMLIEAITINLACYYLGYLENKVWEIDNMVDQIKAMSCYCSLSRMKIASCTFWNPRECLKRQLQS